jgi:hypothetical protein
MAEIVGSLRPPLKKKCDSAQRRRKKEKLQNQLKIDRLKIVQTISHFKQAIAIGKQYYQTSLSLREYSHFLITNNNHSTDPLVYFYFCYVLGSYPTYVPPLFIDAFHNEASITRNQKIPNR